MKADAEWNTDLKINWATCKRIFSKMILTLRDFVNEPHVLPENKLLHEIHFCLTCQSHKANTQQSICNSSFEFIKNKHNFYRSLNVIPYER